MTSIENIPHEILIDILSYLPCTDLASACRVSQYLRVVSQPVLYKSPVVNSSNRSIPPSIQILLCKLLSPSGQTLIQTVRSLELKWDNSDTGLTAQHQSDISLLNAAALRFGLHDPPTQHDAKMILLLHSLPRLQALMLSPPPNHDPFTDLMGAAPPTQSLPSAFHNLHHFKCSSPLGSGVRPTSLLVLLNLPNIRSIDVHIMAYFTLDTTKAIISAGTSLVRKLRFANTDLPASFLDPVLKIPAVLTHFSYFPWSADIHFTIAPVLRALEPHRSTLQYLQLDLDGLGRSGHVTSPTVSLRDWPVLHTVSASLVGLLGQRKGAFGLADVLPEGLRELEILEDVYWSGKQGVDEVVEMLRRRDEMAVLERVVLGIGERTGLRSVELLRCLGESVGVLVVDNRRVRMIPRVRTKVTSCWRGRVG
ncbi:hypothetical protein Q9L58_010185 [Maublancomyces gigas]|uniref:F-box domain-containing protein n=1 Tax=Discina gigas TaxID=1032678 RepID=A0ABR3G4T3_9PEZI